jgi:hypothetical protein
MLTSSGTYCATNSTMWWPRPTRIARFRISKSSAPKCSFAVWVAYDSGQPDMVALLKSKGAFLNPMKVAERKVMVAIFIVLAPLGHWH